MEGGKVVRLLLRDRLDEFVENLEKGLYERYKVYSDIATPSQILLAVLNAVSGARAAMRPKLTPLSRKAQAMRRPHLPVAIAANALQDAIHSRGKQRVATAKRIARKEEK